MLPHIQHEDDHVTVSFLEDNAKIEARRNGTLPFHRPLEFMIRELPEKGVRTEQSNRFIDAKLVPIG